MIVRIAINTKEIRCYGIRRISHIDIMKPVGKICLYEIKECYSHKIIGKVEHLYDDSPEVLVMKVMKTILKNKKVD